MPKTLNRMLGPPGAADRWTTFRRRLLGAARFLVLACVAAVFNTGAAPATAPAAAPTTAPAGAAAPVDSGAIPPDVVAALRGLKAPSASEREKLYGVIAEQGDARVIPALTAFQVGQLMLRDDRLMRYGKATETNENGQMVRRLELIDALTGAPILGPDGQPVVEKINLSKAFRAPLGETQKKPLRNLILTLSLVHPDPQQRITSVREASERAGRVFPDPSDETRLLDALKTYTELSQKHAAATAASPAEAELAKAIAAALAEKPAGLMSPVPSEATVDALKSALSRAKAADAAITAAATQPSTLPAEVRAVAAAHERLGAELDTYKGRLDALKENTEELPTFAAAFKRQLAADPSGRFAPTLREAVAMTDAALGDPAARDAAIAALGESGTARAENLLRKLAFAAERSGDKALSDTVAGPLRKAAGYQTKVRLAQYTFAGLSTGSIYVLLALGLAIIFGLMGVINMAHGEFMMVGAFTTYAVASWFKQSMPGAYDYFPIVAVPAAFAVAGLVGLLTEYLVIRHLYGRTTDTLVATIGIGFVLVWAARRYYGDNLSYAAPRWMQGSWEVLPDLNLNLARLWTIVYCVLCVGVVYLIVNKTKLGLLLRATTQNRKMASALGVPTRGVDALTFAFGAGLAGMAGVVVPMIDKINPNMGQDYVVMSFMVVVVGGVGKLAGALISGLGLGAIGNYLEPLLGSIQTFARTSSVLSKVLVLAAIVVFLQKRPSGLFPPKGRVADA